MPKRVLVTGLGGFVASNCLKYWLEHTDWNIVALDSFRHKGYYSRLEETKRELPNGFATRVKIFQHDLSVPIDRPLENLLLDRAIDEHGCVVDKPIDLVLNFASDSAVERSNTDPIWCWRNNCELIANMLEFARRTKPKMFIHISTDEVYGQAPPAPDPGHKEWDVIKPSNVYAASKAAQEAICVAYWRAFDVPVVITNTMNIIGERQDPEKFLPRIIQCVAQRQEIPIYADPVHALDINGNPFPGDHWNHVDPSGLHWSVGSRVYLDAWNQADALIFLSDRPTARYSEGAQVPDRYNIVGDTELNNLELAQMVAKLMGKELKYRLVPSETARPGYDRRYMLDGSKMANLGWKAPVPLEITLQRLVDWTLKHVEWMA